MSDTEKAQMDDSARAKANATSISAFKKLSHLASLSEDDFRDKVVRPLFLKKGLRDGRELCGPDEEGKDCLFVEEGKVKKRLFHAVQTKKGTLNMSREPKHNVAEAIAQLRLALEVQYPLTAEHKKVRPDYVILCVSGKANTAARKHIVDQLDDDRILIQDANDLIPEIDEYYPEYWYGIDAEKFPYYTNLKQELAAISDVVLFEDSGAPVSPVSERYVTTYVYRFEKEVKRSHGKTYSEPKMQKIPVGGVLKRKETLIVVVGDGGAGKTTALRRLAYQIVEETIAQAKPGNIPVLLRAKEVALDTTRLLDLVAEETKRVAKAKNPCFTTDDLAEGRVTILVDALDEVTSTGGRRLVLEKILSFHKEHPKCRVVLTSRTEAFKNEADLVTQFVQYEVSSLSTEQVEQLVTKLVHVRSLPPDTAQETLRKLKDVHGVTMNPLLVTIFVATSDFNRQDVPANITEVFKKYTEMMLGRWDQTKGFSQQHKYKIKDYLLQRLALHMHRSKVTSLPTTQVRQLIETELTNLGQENDTTSLFAEMTDRSCLLRINDSKVEFRHLLFQEFFAGRGLRDRSELREVIHDQWWKHAAVFYFGENPANQHEITSLTAELDLKSASDIYTAAIAIGLATQACYLSRMTDRIQSLKWVAESLGNSMQGVIEDFFKLSKNPLLGFILYYAHAKDSVGSTIIQRVLPLLDGGEKSEAARFWCLVGLIEAGELESAYEAIRHFRPVEQRFLLAIVLSCIVTEGLRITSAANRGFASKIRGLLETKVKHLAMELSKEFDSLLLEVRGGEMKSIKSSPKALPEHKDGGDDSPITGVSPPTS